MKQLKHSKIYLLFFLLQLFVLVGFNKQKQLPIFGSNWNTLQTTKATSPMKKANLEPFVYREMPPIDYKFEGKVIVINPGHQKNPDNELEAIAPGSNRKKAKVSIGTRGRISQVPEYAINLLVAKKLKALLVKQGYRVILTRESNEVDISNKERTLLANQNHADLLLHIHCNGSNNEKLTGSLAMCPTADSPYCSKIYEPSKKLCELILAQLDQTLQVKNNGVLETDFMTGINYSKVPVCFLELGYLTNQKEEQKLIDSSYQDELANGIAKGIKSYFIYRTYGK
ncbi:N-acetylmuramoyl-L-alanine amidase [Lachnospiraceae bacterium KM106-2]|nr:N-acetylmuramoyl-L-alanine amidase [Lachnospiraceae bacterium KM106-2]